MEGISGEQQWRIEGFAVERHQSFTGREKIDQGFEHGGFFGRVTQEELPECEFPIHKAGHANQKSDRARSAGDAGGFSIQESIFVNGQIYYAGIIGPLGNGGKWKFGVRRDIPMQIILSKHLPGDEGFTARGGEDFSSDD